MRSLTSEEKLLKIIRKKDNPLYANSKPGGNSSEDDKTEQKRSEVDLLGLVNKLLIFASIGSLGFLGYKYYIFKAKGPLIPSLSEGVVLHSKGFDIDLFEDKEPFSYYEGIISQRNIFQASWEKETAGVVKQVEEVLDIRRKIRLVGVLLDSNPTAIIEDIDKHKTLFMSIGDTLDGAVLEEIQEGKAIFLQDNDRIEIIP
ncbi:MAG: hypothetical protein KKD07_01365 [Candidatus Omnitrophica bacterium]|nr:hypothetical protein [Candidatus Omnitrophota bacterium]MBU1996272.1 hypothetical protein [Candidatus Omnitrophota bacterium]MBU4333070.1 hypothetical protein [Candidatus Omnitrophota bacterium]